MPDLTLVLCSRNDRHEGDSVWRLSTALNFLAFEANRLGVESRLEVVVSDWGSKTPLSEAVALTEEAAELCGFLHTPPDLARELQGDSPFCEVLANNAAIRRSRGRFIGRIDQDTLVGGATLEPLLELMDAMEGPAAARRLGLPRPLEESFCFIGRRGIPVAFADRRPPFEEVIRYIDRFGGRLPREGQNQRPWYDAPVGVVVLSRDLWWKYGAYDERLRYWGFMETDLGLRVAADDGHLNLEAQLGGDLFHLGHGRRRILKTRRRRNPRRVPTELHPNAGDWGLADRELAIETATARTVSPLASGEGRPVGWSEAAVVEVDRVMEKVFGWGRWTRGLVQGDRIAPVASPTDSEGGAESIGRRGARRV